MEGHLALAALDALRRTPWGYAVAGGTGRFWNARGELTLHARNSLGTELDFVFQIAGCRAVAAGAVGQARPLQPGLPR